MSVDLFNDDWQIEITDKDQYERVWEKLEALGLQYRHAKYMKGKKLDYQRVIHPGYFLAKDFKRGCFGWNLFSHNNYFELYESDLDIRINQQNNTTQTEFNREYLAPVPPVIEPTPEVNSTYCSCSSPIVVDSYMPLGEKFHVCKVCNKEYR